MKKKNVTNVNYVFSILTGTRTFIHVTRQSIFLELSLVGTCLISGNSQTTISPLLFAVTNHFDILLDKHFTLLSPTLIRHSSEFEATE